MIRWLCTLLVGAIVSGFAYLLVTGRYTNDGPVLLRLSREHGLHVGDLFVAGGWFVAMAALVALAAMPRRSVRN